MKSTRGIVTAAGLTLIAVTAVADVKQDLDAVTGSAHTRVVWMNGGDRLSPGGALWGYDSRDNAAGQIRAGAHGKPNLCNGGHSIATTAGGRVIIVDFATKQTRDLTDGSTVTDVWKNPADGKEYAIVIRSGGLYRVNINDASDNMLLWNQSETSYCWSVSGDGQLAADHMPWPDGPWVIDNAALQTNPPRTKMGTGGCWSSVAPDNSHIWFHLNWPHQTVTMYRDKSQTGTARPQFTHPPGDGQEIYHPKFASNGARFMALTAGYPGNTGEPYEFGGAPLTTGISDPAPAQVYQTVRHTDHSYTFADVPDGKYTVRIHFTDAYAEGRAMNYTIEGHTVLTGFNIADAAGGSNRVVVEEFDVTVSDGNGLQIVCGQGSGNDVFEAAIEVLSAASAVTTAGRRGASRRSCHGISLTADGRLVIDGTETVRRLVLVDLGGAVVAATEPRGRRIVPLPGACVSGMYAARLVTDQGTRSYRLVVP